MTNPPHENLLVVVKKLLWTVAILVVGLILVAFIAIFHIDVTSLFQKSKEELAAELQEKRAQALFKQQQADDEALKVFWKSKDIQSIQDENKKKQLLYGQDLIAHTAKYLGPKGSVMQITNGMNCQNCHLDAGTKIWGNNYGSVFSTYPKYRARSGQIEDIYKRINDCLERSLNGKALPEQSTEMQAIKSYIEFVGSGVKKGEKAVGAGIYDLAFLNRPLDPNQGKLLYTAKCQSCHQANGEGVLNSDQTEYTYPPLWGDHSYNQGAGLYRMSRFAGYIRYNMPQGATFQQPQLSNEEAWDIAAFVNSQPRPGKDISKDWPKIEEKPVDHPFGPFADTFSEKQHKYGPFDPIQAEKKRLKNQQSKKTSP